MSLFHLNYVKVFKEMSAVYQVNFVLFNKSKKRKVDTEINQYKKIDFIRRAKFLVLILEFKNLLIGFKYKYKKASIIDSF